MRLKQVLASTALVATVFTGTAMAANLSGTPTTYSREGVALVPSTTKIALPSTSITLQAQYAETDLISMTVVGPALDASSAPDMACPAGIVIGFLGRTGNTVSFRVTQVNTGFSTIGVTCTMSGLKATGAVISAVNSVVVNYSAQTSGGLALDTGCVGTSCVPNTATIATVRDQFNSVTTTAFNQVVDVNKFRYEFETGTDDAFTFVQWTDGNVNPSVPANPADAATFTYPATATAGDVVLSGDFSWLDADGKNGCSLAEYQAAVTTSVGNVTAGNTACTAVTIVQGSGEGSVTITLTPLAASAKKVLPAQSFSAVVTLSYDGGTADIDRVFTLNAGKWTLNGFSAFVTYMPFGDGISTIVYASNSSSQSGAVTIDGFNQAGTPCSFNAGTIAPNSTMSLSGAINSGFASCYGAALAGSRVAFTVVINIPSSAGDLYTAYNVGGADRGTVVNSANGK